MKKVLSVLLALVLIGALAGCSSSSKPANDDAKAKTESSAKPTTVRFALHLAKEHSLGVAAQKFADLLEQKSNGKYKVEVYYNSALGTQREEVEGMQLGTIEMSINDPGIMSNFEPKMAVLDLPYTFRDYDHVHKVLDGNVGKELADGLQTKGVRLLAWTDSAFRDVLINKPVHHVADLKGVKLRVPEAPAYFKTVQAWGASPQAIPWGDTYTAIQTGVVSGMEGSAESVYTAKMQEVTKYLVRTNHIYTAVAFNISDKFFSGLSPEDQKLFEDSAKEAADYGRQLAMSRDSEYRQKLLDGGMQEIKVDVNEFKQAVEPEREKMIKDLGVEDIAAEIAATK